MRRRNVTGVISDPKGGDARSVSPVWEKPSGLYRESEIIQPQALVSRSTRQQHGKVGRG